MKLWYAFYGWKEDPFSTRPKTKLVGLDDEMEYLQHLTQTGAMILLSGPTGSGKSSVLMWLEGVLKSTNITPIRINCLIKHATETIETEIKHHRKLIDKFCFRSYPKNPVLLLDEAQNLNKDAAEFIKAQWDESFYHSIVFASIDSVLKGFSGSLRDRLVGQTVVLPNLSYNDAIKLISLRTGGNNPFTQEAIESIVKISANIPRRILENCRAVCKEGAPREIRVIDHNLVYETIGRMEIRPIKPITPIIETPRKRRKKAAPEYVSPIETKNETIKAPVSPTATSRETMRIAIRKIPFHVSPAQVEIIRLLCVREATSEEIAKLLHISGGSARKQISRLIANGAVRVIVQQRPKKYGLTPECKRAVIKE